MGIFGGRKTSEIVNLFINRRGGDIAAIGSKSDALKASSSALVGVTICSILIVGCLSQIIDPVIIPISIFVINNIFGPAFICEKPSEMVSAERFSVYFNCPVSLFVYPPGNIARSATTWNIYLPFEDASVAVIGKRFSQSSYRKRATSSLFGLSTFADARAVKATPLLAMRRVGNEGFITSDACKYHAGIHGVAPVFSQVLASY